MSLLNPAQIANLRTYANSYCYKNNLFENLSDLKPQKLKLKDADYF
ncbi:hypothetical protein J4440_06220 [Candidatus Woesearchaeota archaeon]|nr:hypothetical protein [Candidatus Woesearchaeota archaeon]